MSLLIQPHLKLLAPGPAVTFYFLGHFALGSCHKSSDLQNWKGGGAAGL